MRDKKWTKSPWTVMDSGAITLIYGNTERSDRVARVQIMENVGERKANANLIAAAPELLEALEKLLYLCELEPLEDSYCEIDAAEAAIKKAYGE